MLSIHDNFKHFNGSRLLKFRIYKQSYRDWDQRVENRIDARVRFLQQTLLSD